MNRTAGFLLILLLTGCSFLPTPVVEPTRVCPTCVPGGDCSQRQQIPAGCPPCTVEGCGTATHVPTTEIVPTQLQTDLPGTEEPALTETPAIETAEVTETIVVQTPTNAVDIESETPFIPTGMADVTLTPTVERTVTPGPTPTSTEFVSDKLYIPQDGTPRLIKNFARPEKACQWMGVAGQVFGAGGAPMKNLVVVVSGSLQEEQIDMVGLTGLATAYGPGGFEIELSNKAVATSNEMFIQLYDLAGAELSDPYPFNTSADCARNLILINFVPN
jgi:hypothetical protein